MLHTFTRQEKSKAELLDVISKEMDEAVASDRAFGAIRDAALATLETHLSLAADPASDEVIAADIQCSANDFGSGPVNLSIGVSVSIKTEARNG